MRFYIIGAKQNIGLPLLLESYTAVITLPLGVYAAIVTLCHHTIG